jgi:hypothetical protein
MIRNKWVHVLGNGCLILALATGGLAADPAPPESSAAKTETTTAKPAVAAATNADSVVTQDASAATDDPVICKKIDVTGSRVRKEKICRTKSQWVADTKAAKDFVKGVERGTASQPGGEGLPTGD